VLLAPIHGQEDLSGMGKLQASFQGLEDFSTIGKCKKSSMVGEKNVAVF
jgi:hypothetical protein